MRFSARLESRVERRTPSGLVTDAVSATMPATFSTISSFESESAVAAPTKATDVLSAEDVACVALASVVPVGWLAPTMLAARARRT